MVIYVDCTGQDKRTAEHDVITVTATDSGGLTDTANRTWLVAANEAPTITLDQSNQDIAGGGTLSIAATATAPETGQTVTVTWQALNGGSVSPTSGTTTTFTAPAAVSSDRTYQVRATATDSLNLTATATVTLTVRGVMLPATTGQLYAVVSSPPRLYLIDHTDPDNTTDSYGLVGSTSAPNIAGITNADGILYVIHRHTGANTRLRAVNPFNPSQSTEPYGDLGLFVPPQNPEVNNTL